MPDIPIIETRSIYEDVCDQIIRCDRVGESCFLTYGVVLIDPAINDGQAFVTPTVRLRWPLRHLLAHRGMVAAWLASGPRVGSYIVPLIGAASRVPNWETLM